MALIFGLSSLPHVPTPSQPGSDKVGHAVLYGGLAAVALRALVQGRWRQVAAPRALGAVAIAAGYGAVDEWRQGFVEGRVTSTGDWIADLAGAALAVIAALAMARRRLATDREV
jgi:VanZ family protein